MKLRGLPSQKYLKECFIYDPIEGFLLWRIRPLHHFTAFKNWKRWNQRYAGKLAINFLNERGYRIGSLNKKRVLSHRIIWKLETGIDPLTIDHINGITFDNRMRNLRSVTQAENNKNLRKRKDNTSGIVGVIWHKSSKKWHARINTKFGRKVLGCFDHKHEAISARRRAELTEGYHPRHGQNSVTADAMMKERARDE